MDFVSRKVRLCFDSTESKANKHGQTEPQDVRQQGRTWSKVYLGEVREEGEERVSDHLLTDPLVAAVFLCRIYRKGVRERRNPSGGQGEGDGGGFT